MTASLECDPRPLRARDHRGYRQHDRRPAPVRRGPLCHRSTLVTRTLSQWMGDGALDQGTPGADSPVEILEQHVERELPDEPRQQVVHGAQPGHQPVEAPLPIGVP